MKRLSKVAKQDWRLTPMNPDPGFDPEHNKRVIEETIRENDLKFKANQKIYDEEVAERAKALSYYIKAIDQGGRNTDISQYFGKKEIARLRGEEIMRKLKERSIMRFRDEKES